MQSRQRSDGWLVVRGNHEDYVIGVARPEKPHTHAQREFFAPVYYTYRQLNGDVSALDAMPTALSLTAPDGGEIRITHASMHSRRRGIFPNMPDDTLRPLISPPPALFCVGHTHQPLVRRLDGCLVVNAGSVGLPFDGDTRAAYARLTFHRRRWHAEIVRLPYDLRRAERDFFETGFIEGGGPLAGLILDELQHARSLMYAWTKEYEASILSEAITVAEAVSRFMAALD